MTAPCKALIQGTDERNRENEARLVDYECLFALDPLAVGQSRGLDLGRSDGSRLLRRQPSQGMPIGPQYLS